MESTMGARKPRTLTLGEWATLVRAIDPENREARQVLALLLHTHGITLEKLDNLLEPSTQPPPLVPPGGWVSVEQTPFHLEEDSPEGALPNMEDGDPVLRWELVTESAELRTAVGQLALDANAVRPALEGGWTEAMLVHPSVFCPRERDFLGVIAVLLRRGVLFRLYRVRRLGEANMDTVLLRLYPEPGSDTMALLETFHPDTARDIQNLGKRITEAMRLLGREGAS
jgi:hypothetical protein